jgi:uncharacterized membrane protein
MAWAFAGAVVLAFADLPLFAGAAVLLVIALDSVPLALGLGFAVAVAFRAFVAVRRRPVPDEQFDSLPAWTRAGFVVGLVFSTMIGGLVGALAVLTIFVNVWIALVVAPVLLLVCVNFSIKIQRAPRTASDGATLKGDTASEVRYAAPWLAEALPHSRQPPPGPA